VDKTVSPNSSQDKIMGKPQTAYAGKASTEEASLKLWNVTEYNLNKDISEPCRIKFNSSPHAIFGFNWTNTYQ